MDLFSGTNGYGGTKPCEGATQCMPLAGWVEKVIIQVRLEA